MHHKKGCAVQHMKHCPVAHAIPPSSSLNAVSKTCAASVQSQVLSLCASKSVKAWLAVQEQSGSKCVDSLSTEGLLWLEQGDGEPEGAAFPNFGHGPQQTAQHRHLLGADAQAQPSAPPCSGSLHVILCPL